MDWGAQRYWGAKDCVPAALLNTVLGSLSASEHRAGFNSPALHRLNALGDTAHKNVCSTVREYSTLASAAPGSPTSPLHLHLRDTSYVIPGPIATALCARHDVLCAVLVVATQLTDTAQWRELQWQDTAVVPPEAHGSRVGLWLYLCTHLPKRPSYYDADLCATYDDVRNIWIFTCSPLSVTLTPAAAARAARIVTNVAAARGSQVVHPAQVDICVGRVCAFCAKKVRHMSASISEWYQRTYMATGLTPADGMRLVQHCHLKLCKDKHIKTMSAAAWRTMNSVKIGAEYDHELYQHHGRSTVLPSECPGLPAPDWVVTVLNNPVLLCAVRGTFGAAWAVSSGLKRLFSKGTGSKGCENEERL